MACIAGIELYRLNRVLLLLKTVGFLQKKVNPPAFCHNRQPHWPWGQSGFTEFWYICAVFSKSPTDSDRRSEIFTFFAWIHRIFSKLEITFAL